MVEPRSFEEGARIGGRIVWRETEENLQRRKKPPVDIFLLPVAVSITVPTVVLLLVSSRMPLEEIPALGLPQFTAVALAILIPITSSFLLFILLYLRAEKILSRLTLITVYENGISISVRELPYYGFPDIVGVEQITRDQRKRDWRFTTVLKFSDGTSCILPNQVFPDDTAYDRFHKALAQSYSDFKNRETEKTRPSVK